MLTSLYAAISGMGANGTALSVIGDNIANLNTVGFKGSRISFGDVLSQTLAGGSSQVGRGAMISSITPLFTQGSFETTASGLDLAIDGDGFFVVSEGNARYYTRAGQFSISKNGDLVNTDNLILQGFIADASGNITGTTGDLSIAATQSPANATTTAAISVNLESGAAVPGAAFALNAVTGIATNYNSSTTISVYDSQGAAHDVTAYFVKTAANAWSVHYVYKNAAGAYIDAAAAGTQDLTFNTGAVAGAVGGSLADDDDATAMAFTWGGGVANSSITFNYGTGTAEAGSGLDGSTQFSSDFAVMNLNQNGYSSGSLRNVVISEDGIITGVFTNGQTRSVGQIALAKFISTSGLSKLGRNLYAESYDSGQPIIGIASTSGLGRVLSNSLELSNVDLAEEFVKLISAQRGFQANSRIITTTDELMQELVNLKR